MWFAVGAANSYIVERTLISAVRESKQPSALAKSAASSARARKNENKSSCSKISERYEHATAARIWSGDHRGFMHMRTEFRNPCWLRSRRRRRALAPVSMRAHAFRFTAKDSGLTPR